MMALDGGGAAVAIKDLDVWAGSSPLIEGVTWTIMPKERWSLLGPNGCGKSTLLKTISSIAVDRSGAEGSELANYVSVDGKLRFGMLEQTAVSGSETSVREEVMSRMGAYQQAKAELQAAEAACVSGDAAEVERLEKASADFEAAGGYSCGLEPSMAFQAVHGLPRPPTSLPWPSTSRPRPSTACHECSTACHEPSTELPRPATRYSVDSRVSRVLKGLGFEDGEFERPCSSFSGGWQMRIGLARLLLSEPELLVMDEVMALGLLLIWPLMAGDRPARVGD